MLSVIAGGLIFIGMTYIGILVKNQYAMRYKFLKYMYDFIAYAEREITLYKTPKNVIISKFIALNGEDKDRLLSKYGELSDKNFNNIFALTEVMYLKKNDRQLIAEFLSNFGKGNYKEEIKYLEGINHSVNLLKEEASAAMKKEGKLYSQLMAMIGIALMIIVV